jgi:putative DNA primase/helicase
MSANVTPLPTRAAQHAAALLAHLTAVGLTPDGELPPLTRDVEWRHFRCAGDTGTKQHARLRVWADGFVEYQHFKRNIFNGEWWPDGDLAATDEERAAAARQRRAVEADKERGYAEGAETAREWLAVAKPATAEHPYVARKQISPEGLYVGPWTFAWQDGDAQRHRLRVDNALAWPMFDKDGNVCNLELIAPHKLPDGSDKRVIAGARCSGVWGRIGDWSAGALEHIAIVEGWATGASVHEARGWLVAVARSTAGLMPTGVALRDMLPTARLTFAGDNDRFTDGNPGVTDARAAAAAVGGYLAIPKFSEALDPPGLNSKNKGRTDFNDLATSEGIEVVRAQLDAAQLVDPRPQILHNPENLRAHVDEVDALLGERDDVFEFNGRLVQMQQRPSDDPAEPHAPHLHLLVEPTLAAIVSDHVVYRQRNARGGSRLIRPPRDVMDALLKRGQHQHIKPLAGVVTAPTLRADGTLVTAPGYDPASRLFFDPQGVDWPAVPEAPTLAEAQAALAALRDPFNEFPWAGDNPELSEAVFLAAVLTGLTRHQYGATPMFFFTAPAKGTGKTKLAQAVSLLVTGHRAAQSTFPTHEEERRKVVTAALIEGAQILFFDNVRGEIESATLENLTTSDRQKDRVLGVSQNTDIRNRLTVLVTGNNARPGEDLSRRVLECRIDARSEQPFAGREFRIPDLLGYLREHRPRLVTAALTVVRGYVSAGRPPPPTGAASCASFEDWARCVRDPLVWAGMPDVGTEFARIDAESGQRDQIAVAFEWLRIRFSAGGDPQASAAFSARDLAEALKSANADAFAKLEPVLGRITQHDKPTARMLTDRLKNHKDQVAGGLRLTYDKGNGSSQPATFRVVGPQPESGGKF